MKPIFIAIFLFVIVVFSANAQDLIILRDGNTIEALVIEISSTEIRYKRFNHLDGPTIVIQVANVLSIRYANGTTEIFNAPAQPVTTTPGVPTQSVAVQEEKQFDSHLRLNSLGLSLGYLGVSNFGFSLSGTVSPANYTFFDFNLGLGFSNFSLNGSAAFGGFVPFSIGGWYGGLGIGGGMYQFFDSMNGYFVVNAIMGLILFDWMNISVS